MDPIASARVPAEIKRQGDDKLKKLGATTTELINAAYQYLLEVGSLPSARVEAEDQGNRHLSADQLADFRAFMAKTSLKPPASWEGKSYEDLYEDAMQERYATYLV